MRRAKEVVKVVNCLIADILITPVTNCSLKGHIYKVNAVVDATNVSNLLTDFVGSVLALFTGKRSLQEVLLLLRERSGFEKKVFRKAFD